MWHVFGFDRADRRKTIDVTKYDSFEAIYEELGDAVPADLARTMKLACDFNRLVYAARVRYNYILSNGQNEDAVEEWAYIEENMQHMMSVDVDDVLQVETKQATTNRTATAKRGGMMDSMK